MRSGGTKNTGFTLYLGVFMLATFLGVFYLKDKSHALDGPQDVRVLVENLNGTIESFNWIDIPGCDRIHGNLPRGLLERIYKGEDSYKANMIIGMVLRSDVNDRVDVSFIMAYKSGNNIVWKENLGYGGRERVWVFLKQGVKPDPKFLRIIE